jgi:hypothetical protein
MLLIIDKYFNISNIVIYMYIFVLHIIIIIIGGVELSP